MSAHAPRGTKPEFVVGEFNKIISIVKIFSYFCNKLEICTYLNSDRHMRHYMDS